MNKIKYKYSSFFKVCFSILLKKNNVFYSVRELYSYYLIINNNFNNKNINWMFLWVRRSVSFFILFNLFEIRVIIVLYLLGDLLDEEIVRKSKCG